MQKKKRLDEKKIMSLTKEDLITEEPTMFELNYVDSDVWKQFEEYMHLLFGEDVDFIHAIRTEEVYFTIESGIMNCIVMNKY